MQTYRFRLQRTPGWRMPLLGRSVAYPTKWQNPYRPRTRSPEANAYAVNSYWRYLKERPELLAQVGELKCWNLGCWCPLDWPCHADLLLDVAAQS